MEKLLLACIILDHNMVMGYFHTFQVTNTSCQTDLVNLTISKQKFNYRQNIEGSELTECHSFLCENTLADDDTPLFVEQSTITAERGGLLVNKITENPHNSNELQKGLYYINTENSLSETSQNNSYTMTAGNRNQPNINEIT